ncbi:MAG: glycosyltransferase family protein [Bacteroidota bacterium]
MKILYGVQGTGNGHITRAMEIIPYLQKKGDLDILISGIQNDIELPFDVKYKFRGLSFIFGKQGGLDLWRTYWKINSRKLYKEIKSLDVDQYDLIISDFEPVTSWACIKAKKPCIGLSNQVATLHPLAPETKKKDVLGKIILRNYAPTNYNYGFHFKSLDKNIYTPIIRKEVRKLKPTNEGHYTVYLPSYDDERIIKNLQKFKDINWVVFSKHYTENYKFQNITILPIDKDMFLKSMASSQGVLCNAGFGTASEALFLKKKLLVIPMKTQYEQHCNAAMLKSMGVPVMKKLKEKYHDKLEDWLNDTNIVEVDYPDQTNEIVDTIIENHAGKKLLDTEYESQHYNLFHK